MAARGDVERLGANPTPDNADATDLAFTVDTHLLRELGALLVGRDSTAVVELIKNAYDADATQVVLNAVDLNAHGTITVTDNGHGMTVNDFTTKFLRIAGRSKEGGSRRSPIYKRKFTGAKGIGRLSAHKLGAALSLNSVPNLKVLHRKPDEDGFTALIDWPSIENSKKSIENTKTIEVTPRGSSSAVATGTVLTIDRLHGNWTTRQLNQFLLEVRSTRPDNAFTAVVPPAMFPGKHLIPTITVSDAKGKDPGFSIELSGDFEGSDSQWPTLLPQLNWMLEIKAGKTAVEYRITPSASTTKQNASARTLNFRRPRPTRGPEFTSRIFIRDGSAGRRPLDDVLSRFAADAAGIRVYSEGFRVLPYGGRRNDWLGIDADYARRTSLDIDEEEIEKPEVDERVYLLAGQAYFGGVFLLDSGSHGLEMVVNREGFLPNAAYEDLTSLVRRGVDLTVRARAALGVVRNQAAEQSKTDARQRANDAVLSGANDDPSTSPESEPVETRVPEATGVRLERWLDIGKTAASALRMTQLADDTETIRNVRLLTAAIDEVSTAAQIAKDEQAQLRVLASIGTQMGAFVHEINGVLSQARIVVELLDRMIEDGPPNVARLRDVRRAQTELVASLERQAVYLADSLDAESRRRRTRQSVHNRVATAFRLLQSSAAIRHVDLVDETPRDLRTRPMFAAEVNVILTNILSNAVKAAAQGPESGRLVRVEGDVTTSGVLVRVSNTGARVDLDEAERWFQPFETTTSDVDAVLGQGLGLGLPLTRRIVEEYGGTMNFVRPAADMATAIEVVLPSR